jgi:hypothetical protein
MKSKQLSCSENGEYLVSRSHFEDLVEGTNDLSTSNFDPEKETRGHLENPTPVTFHLGTPPFKASSSIFSRTTSNVWGMAEAFCVNFGPHSARANTEGQIAQRKVKGS